MLIVPGFAVPAGTNLFDLLTTKIGKVSDLFQNFYLLPSGDFFIILLIQQTCFGFFGTITQLGLLYSFYFSPSAYLWIKNNATKNFQLYLKHETTTFDFGYVYSLNFAILGIVLIYSFFNKNSYPVCFILRNIVFHNEVYHRCSSPLKSV